MRLTTCAECGAPFKPKRARQTHCEAHDLRGRDGSSPTTRAQNAEYAAERRRVLAPGAVCHWCGAPATTVDHLVPVARGGQHRANLVACCGPCNSSRQANPDWRPPRTGQATRAPLAPAARADDPPPPLLRLA